MQKHDNCTPEEKLAKLLSSLKTEPVFPDNFEEKFLQEMHRRRAEEPVRKTASAPIRETVGSFLYKLFRAKWVYGAATAITAVVILAVIMFDNSPTSDSAMQASNDHEKSHLQPVSVVKENDATEEAADEQKAEEPVQPVSQTEDRDDAK